ncbi:Cytochrome P450 [Phytophthora infestans]|uniref:Cytochrome P450 n=1 Tax=Phytophthora infestans TaxID=4787 RepID=A0A8S9UES0_PHYIN|nr:Cytochrome P450 [Phytophthora infestans]
MLPISTLTEKSSENLVIVAISSLVLLFAASRLKTTKRGSTDKRAKIHAPDSTLPLIGNTWDLLIHGVKGDMHDFTTRLGKQLNAEPIVIRALGIPRNIILFTPEAFEDVLKTQFHNFEKGPFMCENLRDLLGDGIFAVDGDPWVHQRKTASHLFTMRTLRESMTTVIQRHAVTLYAILQRACDNHNTLDLFKLFNRFTIEAFAEIGFGVHMGCLDSDKEHPFQKAFDRAQRVFNFDSHDQTPKSHQFDPNYLRNIVVNFLIAGRDTTAQALSWFFVNLSNEPRVEAAIRKEIEDKLPTLKAGGAPAMQDVSELVYLEAALKETLRLHPSVPFEPKQAREDTTLSDWDVCPSWFGNRSSNVLYGSNDASVGA